MANRIVRMRSEPPLVLRPTTLRGLDTLPRWNVPALSPARVSLVGGAAGPLGGDRFRLSIEVESGAAFVLRGVAATIVLPRAQGEPSLTEVVVRVAEGGVLVFLPCPTVAARACHHRAMTDVSLEPGARLLLREEARAGASWRAAGQDASMPARPDDAAIALEYTAATMAKSDG